MKVAEFLQLLKRARREYGYTFHFGSQHRIIPLDTPEMFATVESKCIRWELEGEARSLLPAEAVWHCFEADEDSGVLPGRVSASFDALGIKQIARRHLLAAGEEYHVSPLDGEKAAKVSALRRDLLKACGLKEVPIEDRRVVDPDGSPPGAELGYLPLR